MLYISCLLNRQKYIYFGIKKSYMLGKIKADLQENLFKIRLSDLINLGHPLVKLDNEVS